jgi:hypothetical protein
MVAEASLPTPTFYVGEGIRTGDEVSLFGTDPSQDDHDLSACVRNIQRAKTQWAAVSKVLRREECRRNRLRGYTFVIVSTVCCTEVTHG